MIWKILRTALSVTAAFLGGWALGAGAGVSMDLAVLAVVIAVTVGETPAVSAGRRLLPLIGGFAATAVLGWALHLLPSGIWFFSGLAVVSVGATLVTGLGRWGRTAGRVLIRAVSALVFFPAPLAANLSGHPGLILLTVAVALTAGFLAGFLGPREEAPETGAAGSSMALARSGQQAAAFLLTLVLVPLWIPSELPWAFITAFVVSVSTRTRLELAVKSVTRLLGASAGALVGIATMGLIPGLGPWLPVPLLAVLVAGAYLRQFSYAWWAATVTLLLTVLYALIDPRVPVPILPRLGGIVLGAAAAVIVAFVLVPLRSRRVLRGLLGRAFAALDEVLVRVADGSEMAPAWAEFDRQLNVFEKAARAAGLRRFPASWHPVTAWLSGITAVRADAQAVVQAAVPGEPRPWAGLVRKILGAVRKMLAGKESEEPGEWAGGNGTASASLRTLYGDLRALYTAVRGSAPDGSTGPSTKE